MDIFKKQGKGKLVLSDSFYSKLADAGAPRVRLSALRKELELNQTDFASGIGLTQSGISAFELGTVPLSRKVALAIEAAYGIRHQWLLHGKPPLKTGGRNAAMRLMPDERRFLDLYQVADKDVRRVVIRLLECTVKIE